MIRRSKLTRLWMLAGQAQRLFRRFSAQHLELTLPVFSFEIGSKPEPLGRAANRMSDRVTELVLRQNRLLISVETQAEKIELEQGGGRWPMRRVTAAGGQGAMLLDVPAMSGPAMGGPARLWLSHDGQLTSVDLPAFPRWRLGLARARLLLRFVLIAVRGAPLAWRWVRHYDTSARAVLKRMLGLDGMLDLLPLASDVLPETPPEAPKDLSARLDCVHIILAVYNAFDLLPEVLERVVKHSDLPWHLFVIEDCSSDPVVRPFLRDWAAGNAAVDLIESKQNQGFIRSVNLGIAAARLRDDSQPVVLLNSDAFVPDGWLSRLLRPLVEDRTVAR